jgi:hypothetical protein
MLGFCGFAAIEICPVNLSWAQIYKESLEKNLSSYESEARASFSAFLRFSGLEEYLRIGLARG